MCSESFTETLCRQFSSITAPRGYGRCRVQSPSTREEICYAGTIWGPESLLQRSSNVQYPAPKAKECSCTLEGQLLLKYTEWSKAGTESGSEDWPLERIAQVIEPCSVKTPTSLLGIHDVEEKIRTFNVRWAISTSNASFNDVEIRDMAFNPETIISPKELTKIASPSAVDLHCGMGGFSLAFSSVGVKILAGVDNMLASASTWQVHRNSCRTLKDS